MNSILAVLNKRWLSKGWRVMDPADSEPMALSFLEVLNRHKIPHEHYFELYQRSIDLRVKQMNQGIEIEEFSADMMVACWEGKWGLQSELRQREIDARRTLGANAASVCRHCYGTTFRKIDPTDRNSPVRKCDHSDD